MMSAPTAPLSLFGLWSISLSGLFGAGSGTAGAFGLYIQMTRRVCCSGRALPACGADRAHIVDFFLLCPRCHNDLSIWSPIKLNVVPPVGDLFDRFPSLPPLPPPLPHCSLLTHPHLQTGWCASCRPMTLRSTCSCCLSVAFVRTFRFHSCLLHPTDPHRVTQLWPSETPRAALLCSFVAQGFGY